MINWLCIIITASGLTINIGGFETEKHCADSIVPIMTVIDLVSDHETVNGYCVREMNL